MIVVISVAGCVVLQTHFWAHMHPGNGWRDMFGMTTIISTVNIVGLMALDILLQWFLLIIFLEVSAGLYYVLFPGSGY